MAPPEASRYRFPSVSQIEEPSARATTGRPRSKTRGKTWVIAPRSRFLSRVGTLGVELPADQPELILGRWGSFSKILRDLEIPARVVADLLERDLWMPARQVHLSR